MKPHLATLSPRRWRTAAATLVCVLLAGGAGAQTQVFDSPFDDGSDCGMSVCPFVSDLKIWATTPGVTCAGGSCVCSDVCAIDTLVEVEGGSFRAISAESGLVVEPACTDGGDPCTLPANTTSLHFVGSFASDPAPMSGPRRLAKILMEPGAAENATAVSVNGVKLVNAGFTPLDLSTNIIATPEPALLPTLVSGLALTVGLRGRRSRASRPGARR